MRKLKGFRYPTKLGGTNVCANGDMAAPACLGAFSGCERMSAITHARVIALDQHDAARHAAKSTRQQGADGFTAAGRRWLYTAAGRRWLLPGPATSCTST